MFLNTLLNNLTSKYNAYKARKEEAAAAQYQAYKEAVSKLITEAAKNNYNEWERELDLKVRSNRLGQEIMSVGEVRAWQLYLHLQLTLAVVTDMSPWIYAVTLDHSLRARTNYGQYQKLYSKINSVHKMLIRPWNQTTDEVLSVEYNNWFAAPHTIFSCPLTVILEHASKSYDAHTMSILQTKAIRVSAELSTLIHRGLQTLETSRNASLQN